MVEKEVEDTPLSRQEWDFEKDLPRSGELLA
jgi:hypothetical protein